MEKFLDERNAAYDRLAKRFLARKAIPAYILKYLSPSSSIAPYPTSNKIIQLWKNTSWKKLKVFFSSIVALVRGYDHILLCN